jgi:hypothetical protein
MEKIYVHLVFELGPGRKLSYVDTINPGFDRAKAVCDYTINKWKEVQQEHGKDVALAYSFAFK